MNYKNHQEKG